MDTSLKHIADQTNKYTLVQCSEFKVFDYILKMTWLDKIVLFLPSLSNDIGHSCKEHVYY